MVKMGVFTLLSHRRPRRLRPFSEAEYLQLEATQKIWSREYLSLREKLWQADISWLVIFQTAHRWRLNWFLLWKEGSPLCGPEGLAFISNGLSLHINFLIKAFCSLSSPKVRSLNPTEQAYPLCHCQGPRLQGQVVLHVLTHICVGCLLKQRFWVKKADIPPTGSSPSSEPWGRLPPTWWKKHLFFPLIWTRIWLCSCLVEGL